ncbi:CoA-binding protein [Pelobium sp.]|nr:CoA-binding protein [Pelobium sp.]MDA9555280.1 CoA-binding protein [Pelobium sp.]
MKKTLILGATTNPSRYAYLAAHKLVAHGHQIINVGIKKGEVANQPIENTDLIHHDIDTITLYLGPQNQTDYYNYILQTNPKRIIFNPGTENPELEDLASKQGIQTIEACTLVLLSTDQY